MESTFTKSSNTKHKIKLESNLIYALWSFKQAHAGQEATVEVRTSLVGNGAKIKATCWTESGKKLDKIEATMSNNKYTGTLLIPEKCKPDELIYTHSFIRFRFLHLILFSCKRRDSCMNPVSKRTLFVIMLAALAGGVYALDIIKEQLTDKTLYDAAWDGQQLVVVGAGGFVAASSNDTIWNVRSMGTSVDFRSIVWTGSMLITVGKRGTIRTSTNGMSSGSTGSSGVTNDLYTVFWDGNKAIAAGDNGTVITSTDGVSWSAPLNTGIKLRIYDMAWNGNVNKRVYVAVGEQGLILTSTNLSTWDSIRVSGVDRDLYSITWIGSEFIAVGENSMAYCATLTSKDGKIWTATCRFFPDRVYSLVSADSAVIAVGYVIFKISLSGDQKNIHSDLAPRQKPLYSIINKGKQLIAVGAGGCILKSTDNGVTWKPLGPTTNIAPDTRGVRPESAFSIDIAGRSLRITPSSSYCGHDISVEICSVAGRKAASAVYRAGADRIEIPLNCYESGVYVCSVTVDGEKAARSFTMLKNGDAQWLRDR